MSTPIINTVSVKTDNEIEQMSNRNLKAYAKLLTDSYRSLTEHLFHPENGIIPKLQEQLAFSKRANERLQQQLNRVERTTLRNSQYARRESLELHGVPHNFNDDLEGKVVNLINDIAPAIKVKPEDFQAIHRLKNEDNVIVKFISRKKKHGAIIKRSALTNDELKTKHNIHGDIYLNESMCHEVKHLFYLCKRLKSIKKIEYYTFFNGNLKVKTKKDGDFHFIEHVTDLCLVTGMDREKIEDLEEKRERKKRVRFTDVTEAVQIDETA